MTSTCAYRACMRSRSLVAAALAALLVFACRSAEPPPPSKTAVTRTRHVTLLHTNDEHSRLLPIVEDDGVSPKREIGGVVARKAVVDGVRREGGAVFLFNGGDYAQGLPVYDVWQGSAEIAAMNALSYDAITLGNHQFDLDVASLGRSLAGGNDRVAGKDRRVPPAAMPVVVSNMDIESEPALRGVVRPRAVVERNAVRIGVVGAMADGLPSMARLPSTVRMKPTAASVQEQIDALAAEGIDTIVLLSHSGTKADLELVPKLAGVDVVVSAHDHAFTGDAEKLAQAGLSAADVAKVKQPYPVVAKGKDGRTVLVVSAGHFGKVVGRLDVDLDERGVVTAWRGAPSSCGAARLIRASVTECWRARLRTRSAPSPP